MYKRQALGRDDIVQKIRDLDRVNTEDTPDSILKSLTDIIYQASDISLRKRKPPPVGHIKKKKPKKKKWYSDDLESMKRDLRQLGRQLSSDPWNRELRHRVSSLRSQYNKAVKAAKKNHTQSLVNKLDELHDKDPKHTGNLLSN